jgi:thiol-disulfide isomerase/thioredoxin
MTFGYTPLVLILIAGVAGVRGEEPKDAKNVGRVVEGLILTDARKPVEGASIFLCQADIGPDFRETAKATTDANGRYRADLAGFPWSAEAMEVVVLSPGLDVAQTTIAAGKQPAKVDFELKARQWKEFQVRLQDDSGRPAAGVDVICSVRGVPWKTLTTDDDGSCRLSMAQEYWVGLKARPEGARPIKADVNVTPQSPDVVTLPVLPPYRGRVLDSEGRPAPGVKIGGNAWVSIGSDGEKDMGPFYREPVVTNGEGRFVFDRPIELRDLVGGLRVPSVEALLFADPDYRQLAFRTLAPDRAKDEIDVKLSPTRLVRMPFAAVVTPPQLKATLDAEIMIIPSPDRPDRRWYFVLGGQEWSATAKGKDAEHVFETYLPEGSYHVTFTLWDGEGSKRLGEASRDLVVPGGGGPLDTPTVELGPTNRQKMVGRPAPEIDATDLDTGKPVRLADFRGRVVVLEFWGYWCGPCIGSMPHLMELHRKFAGRPLTILAIHDQSVRSRDEYERRIATPRQRFWGGRDLPFPVLIDRPDPARAGDDDPEGDGATIARYGVVGFPTLLVIDANGSLIDSTGLRDHDRLETRIRELLDQAESR